VVRGSEIPACWYAATTMPEQSKHDGPVPPQQYHIPAWCSAHPRAISRFGVVDAPARDDTTAASDTTRTAAASAARMPLFEVSGRRDRCPRCDGGRGCSEGGELTGACGCEESGSVDKANPRSGARGALASARRYLPAASNGAGNAHVMVRFRAPAAHRRLSRTQGAYVVKVHHLRAPVPQNHRNGVSFPITAV
jgi:hypothetical protein